MTCGEITAQGDCGGSIMHLQCCGGDLFAPPVMWRSVFPFWSQPPLMMILDGSVDTPPEGPVPQFWTPQRGGVVGGFRPQAGNGYVGAGGSVNHHGPPGSSGSVVV